MKVVTLNDKDQHTLIKLVDKKMKSMHDKYKATEPDLNEHEIIKHNKKMARLSELRDSLK